MTLNVRGRLLDLSVPVVMGIVNVTPDSFFGGSRSVAADDLIARVGQLLVEGAAIIDIGAVSTRPDAAPVSESEEMRRLDAALSVVRHHFPQAIISIDTFRAEVARRCIEEFGVDIINDISGGADPDIYNIVSCARVPYILMHGATGLGPATIPAADTPDIVPDMLRFFAQRIEQLHDMGVADVIIDPGFGFGKTLGDNYTVLRRLADFHVLGAPLLVGLSRKSMIWRVLQTTPDEALNGTTVLNTLAMMNGADFLRVHNVKNAVDLKKTLNFAQPSE